MTEYIKPDVTVDLWISKPDAAEALMNSSSEAASSYAEATAWIGAAVGIWYIVSKAIKFLPGNHAGIISIVKSIWQPIKKEGADNKSTPPT